MQPSAQRSCPRSTCDLMLANGALYIVTLLSDIATSQPHAAFSALTHGLLSKWSYLSRVVPDVGNKLSLE